jgi:hypothetical protein
MIKSEYTKCPNCARILTEMVAEEKESYGKIPMDSFLKLSDQIKESKRSLDNNDYLANKIEVDFNFETFKINYSAKCNKCHYQYEFNHEENTKDLMLVQKLEK